jgi:molybdopterin molybdotransferase
MSQKQFTLLDPVEAVNLALENTRPITQNEMVSIFDALHRILAGNILCRKSLPAFDNSAMDGYAVKLADAGKTVTIKSTIFAGDLPENVVIEEGSVHKIMTGAFVPESTEAIVPFEDAEVIDESTVKLPDKLKSGKQIRRLGEEIMAGETILEAGALITPAHIAVLASQGITQIPVFRKLRIGVLSTGSEIKEPWEEAAPHQIYNSNSAAIYASCLEMGHEASYLGAIPDDKELFKAKVREFQGYDVIFTSGGVSVGDADFTEEVFVSEGMRKIVHGMALKPGKHAMYGIIGNTTVIGLPGNPLSSLAVFMLFATPVLARMQGRSHVRQSVALAKVAKSFRFKGNRANLILGTVSNGEFTATDDYAYGSGMLTPITRSNCFIVAAKGVDGFEAGDTVRVVMPFTFNGETANSLYSA